MAQRLILAFGNEQGGKVSFNIDDPKTNLTGAEVQAAMDAVITQNIFTTSGGNLISKLEAKVVNTEETFLYEQP